MPQDDQRRSANRETLRRRVDLILAELRDADRNPPEERPRRR
jgi:septum formation topological specificity factor MinE